jgi:hypothetical protein
VGERLDLLVRARRGVQLCKMRAVHFIPREGLTDGLS